MTEPTEKKEAHPIKEAVADVAAQLGVEALVETVKTAAKGGGELTEQALKATGEMTETVGEAIVETAGSAAEIAGGVAEAAVEVAGEVLSNIDI